jgi:mannose-6-phosphate isomerase-like protein (cupin superfamily)
MTLAIEETQEHTLPIMELARQNEQFRKTLQTGRKMQVVLMAVPEGGEIGAESHEGHDQVLVFVEGEGVAVIGDEEKPVAAGDLTFVPSGTFHNFRNTGSGFLKLFTFYAPPEHLPGTEHATKAEADADPHED